jgi:hypothetical protein
MTVKHKMSTSVTSGAAYVLMAFAAVTLTDSSFAQEVALRCDPIYSGPPVLLSIDMARKKVHVGTGDRGWYADGDKYTFAGGPNIPERPNSSGYTACTFSYVQFVSIDNETIMFGEDGSNVSRCGPHTQDCDSNYSRCSWNGRMDFDVGSQHESRKFSIDRATGIYTDDGGGKYQCQRYTGAVIP